MDQLSMAKSRVFVWWLIWCVAATTELVLGNLMCPTDVGSRCILKSSSTNEYFFNVNGFDEMYEINVGNSFRMSCAKTPLNDAAWPQFSTETVFRRVYLKHCAPPSPPATYTTALRRLNVTVIDKLVLDPLPAGTRVTRTSLVDLPRTVSTLEIYAGVQSPPLPMDSDLFDALDQLRALKLFGVKPGRMPPRLEQLTIRKTGLLRLPEPLEYLETLEFSDSNLEVEAQMEKLTRLQSLTLTVPLSAVPALPPRVKKVSLMTIKDRSPAPFRQCAHLESLTMVHVKVSRLPAAWVAECPVLCNLTLNWLMDLTELPAGFLNGTNELQRLQIKNSQLKTLPADLFKYSLRLREIDLSSNRLESLPNELFVLVASRLESLDLSDNRLHAVCDAVGHLAALRTLILSENPLLDLCPSSNNDLLYKERSCLKEARDLELLELSKVGATRICADWLRDMHYLARLDLTGNNITTLWLSDLNSLKRNQNSVIDLSRNNVSTLDATRGIQH
ncbi:hypothetical protein evm_003292 [Chilo suppressalis]|nr:hypothetical protein evm_003292 [Chilo suppressalis]